MDPEVCTVAPRRRPVKNPYRGMAPCEQQEFGISCDFWALPESECTEFSSDSGPWPLGYEPHWEDGEHPDDPPDMQEFYQQRKEAERAEKARKLAIERLLTHCHFPSHLLPFFPESQP